MKQPPSKEILSLPQRGRRRVGRDSASSDGVESEDNGEQSGYDSAKEIADSAEETDDSAEEIDDSAKEIDDGGKSGSSVHVDGSDEASAQNVALPYAKKKIKDDRIEKTYQYEYLDHPADVILHSYGKTLRECFESACISMFNYMCNLNKVEPKLLRHITARGGTLEDLLYNFLTECHFLYGSEYIICKAVDILVFDQKSFFIEAYAYGDVFSPDLHECGTEIKAITKHELRICLKEDLWEAVKGTPRESCRTVVHLILFGAINPTAYLVAFFGNHEFLNISRRIIRNTE
ncbi:hypothetical protein PCYB_132970 [Plasmodium cynomolgi strain B]|uniref:Protein archease-like n=1 Tax=Plasmodium cynomolgi (strain B) TaxID=1120755 RepID=K6UMA1_PLACD|nr:hypothetical protein PCYB_132970 [Plasmodium cynomolgi strain B]GAB68423.1 hypothetical protein PCYB_132970 [Plasmodium cynomolgi strain B]